MNEILKHIIQIELKVNKIMQVAERIEKILNVNKAIFRAEYGSEEEM